MRHARSENVDWYDLPAIYDILHAPGTAREVTGLERIARRFGQAPIRGRRPTWLEPACGSARYLRVAARRGAWIIGFDRSESMIRYARSSFRRRRLRGELFAADMTSFRTPRPVDFAFCTISTVRHLMSDSDMLAHLDCVRRALAPGGVYALGIELCRYGLEFPSEDVWVGARGSCRVRQVVEYLPAPRRGERARRERVISHLTVTSPRSQRHLDTVYDLRSYSLREWARLLDRSEFVVAGVCDPMGGEPIRGPRGHIVGGYAVWVLRPKTRSQGRARLGRGGRSGRS